MNILVACEESQEVCKAFRAKGHEAYSCDILDCSGGHPEWHKKTDVVNLLQPKYDWDMIIAFPPCTHLATSGARWFEQKRKDGRQQKAIDFFMMFANYNCCDKIAIENPVGIMSNLFRKPDQIVQPWMFDDPYRKTTCLWLKGLPKLKPWVTEEPETEIVTFSSGKRMPKWYADAWNNSPEERARIRSKTFPGIAKAMSEQWG